MKNIPRCMSTQHPDNVNMPFFAKNSELGCEEEVQEAYRLMERGEQDGKIILVQN